LRNMPSPRCFILPRPHSLGAVGGLVSSAGIVSREWPAIQSTASFLEANFPKWRTAPLGHTIRTRQMSPSRTGNKTVYCVAINQSMLGWMRLTSLLVRRGPCPPPLVASHHHGRLKNSTPATS